MTGLEESSCPPIKDLVEGGPHYKTKQTQTEQTKLIEGGPQFKVEETHDPLVKSSHFTKPRPNQPYSSIKNLFTAIQNHNQPITLCTNTMAQPVVMVHPWVYRGVTWRTFHFSYTFHSYVLFILFHTSFRIQTPPTCPFHSTMSMLPFYSVHMQVYETCFTYLLFHLYLFQTFQYLNCSSRVVSSLVYTL
jgi:hypothetical protein